jgi:hypothetical protein
LFGVLQLGNAAKRAAYVWFPMIVFTTLALGPEYIRYSFKLLDSFLLHTTDDCQLVVCTDDLAGYEYYSEKKRIHVVNIGEQPEHLTASLKYRAVEEAWKLCSPEFIVYCDADCYLTQDVTADMFCGLPRGLSVPLGRTSYLANEFENGAVSYKARQLEHLADPDISPFYFDTFVERCMIFNTECRLQRFLSIWANLSRNIIDWHMTSAAEMVEIALAADVATYALNDFSGPHPLKDTIWTLERDGAAYSALR